MSDDEVPPPKDARRHLIGSTTSALTGLERRLIAQAKGAYQVEQDLLPAWLRPTKGEHRWQMGLAVSAAIALQVSLPAGSRCGRTCCCRVLEAALLVFLFVASPSRIVRHSNGAADRRPGLACRDQHQQRVLGRRSGAHHRQRQRQ